VFQALENTFIEAFGKHLTGLGKKIAVLAVDPRVPFHTEVFWEIKPAWTS
jgi:hypothetical protein